MEWYIVVVKFVLTVILAVAFGLERQRSHKPIGFGTFTFVSIASCGLSIVAVDLHTDNPLPLLGSIVTGVGFLGAGALVKSNDKIFGFTSAAAIWAFAIIGLLIGIGEYAPAFGIYAVMWLVLFIDRYLEKQGIGSYQRKLIITTNQIIPERDIRKVLSMHTNKCKLLSMSLDKEKKTMALTYLIVANKDELNKAPDLLFKSPWFNGCTID